MGTYNYNSFAHYAAVSIRIACSAAGGAWAVRARRASGFHSSDVTSRKEAPAASRYAFTWLSAGIEEGSSHGQGRAGCLWPPACDDGCASSAPAPSGLTGAGEGSTMTAAGEEDALALGLGGGWALEDGEAAAADDKRVAALLLEGVPAGELVAAAVPVPLGGTVAAAVPDALGASCPPIEGGGAEGLGIARTLAQLLLRSIAQTPHPDWSL